MDSRDASIAAGVFALTFTALSVIDAFDDPTPEQKRRHAIQREAVKLLSSGVKMPKTQYDRLTALTSHIDPSFLEHPLAYRAGASLLITSLLFPLFTDRH